MNAICAQFQHELNQFINVMGNQSLDQVPSSYSRFRRSLDYDEDLPGNFSIPEDDMDADKISTPSTRAPFVPRDDLLDNDLMKNLVNETEKIKIFLIEHIEAFRHASETNAMTTLASLGLVLNFLSLLAIVLDRRTVLTSRMIHGAYIVAQQVLLVFVICFLHLKKSPYHEKYDDLEAINYFTISLGLVQFLQPWMLFALAGHVKGCLQNLFDLGKAPGFPVALVVISLLFAGTLFSIYMPPIRVQFQHGSVLCDVPPIEKLWNLDRIDDSSTELVNVLVYNISYIFAVYLVPSILVAYRSKGIADLLHALQEQPKVLAKCQELACMSLVVSLTCTLHLVFVTIKLVVFLFYLVELFLKYVGDAFVFFQYLSVFANLLIITGTGSHVFVLMRYSPTVQYFLLRVAYRAKMSIQRLFDCLPKWKRKSPKDSHPVVTDASDHA